MKHWMLAGGFPELPTFSTPLTPYHQGAAQEIVQVLSTGHDVGAVDVSPSLLGLSDVISMIHSFLTGYQSKTVVLTDARISYKVPSRQGNLRIKGPGCSSRAAHIAFCNEKERAEFLKFGSATLVVVVKHGGAWEGMEQEMRQLARAMASERVMHVLVLSDDPTPTADWKAAYDAFKEHGKTIAFRNLIG